MDIREANPVDNDELQELQAKCPQGTDLIASIVNTLKQIMITLIGFKDPTHLSLLLKHLNNQVLQRGIEQIFCICERNHVMLKSLKGFIRIDTSINLYVKNLQQENLISDMPVFIDGVDM